MDTIELIKKDLQRTTEIDKFVVLKKDDKGYYIEYAFKEGAPHDNRCLSWYDSYQEEAYRKKGWFKTDNGTELPEDEIKKRLEQIHQARESKVGKVFRLDSFTCGYEEDLEYSLKERKETWNKYHRDENGNPLPFIPEDHICKVGCPAKGCGYVKSRVLPWTYETPVKCACWTLKDGKTMEDFIKEYTICMPATELAKLM